MLPFDVPLPAIQIVMIYVYTIIAFNFFRDQWTMPVGSPCLSPTGHTRSHTRA